MNALLGVGETSEKAASLVRGSAEECARHLLRYLHHHGFVERGTVAQSQSASEGVLASPRAERQPQQSASDPTPTQETGGADARDKPAESDPKS